MTQKLSLLAIFTASVPGCSPFCSPSPRSSAPNTSRSSRSHVLFNNEIIREGTFPETTPVDSNVNNYGRIEFWLDLRGTSISPKTALELWKVETQDANQDDASPSFGPPFSKFLISNIEKQSTVSASDDVIMMGPDGETLKYISQQLPSSFGSVVHLEASQSTSMPILPDPLPLIGKYSSGECIILDTNAWRKAEEGEKLDMLFPLVELITSMQQHHDNKIGWTCHSKSEIVKSAMWIQCQSGRGLSEGRTKTLESGIVILDEESTNPSGLSKGGGTKFVILVPYDVGLLKTAASLLLNDDDSDS